MTRRLLLVLATAVLVSVPAVGCASDDGGDTATQAAPSTSADTGADTLGAGIENLQGQLCSGLTELEGNLTEISTSGTDAGQDVLAGIGSFATALDAAAAALTGAGASDAATAAEDLAASLESLSNSTGEDAQAGAGEAAEKAQQLSDALECP